MDTLNLKKPISRASGNRRQKGSQIMEFALVLMVFAPTLMMTFIAGMNEIKTIQAKQVIRDIGSIYMRGGDFSTYSMQMLARRLATGLGMEVAAFPGGVSNQNQNLAGGNVIIYISQLMYVGATTSPTCAAVGASNCVNHDSFVFAQRVEFGSSAEKTAHPSQLGNYTGASNTITATGAILNPASNASAKLSTAPQNLMANTWNDDEESANGQADLSDGQFIFVVEGYFNTSNLGLGNIPSPGVYARFYF